MSSIDLSLDELIQRRTEKQGSGRSRRSGGQRPQQRRGPKEGGASGGGDGREKRREHVKEDRKNEKSSKMAARRGMEVEKSIFERLGPKAGSEKTIQCVNVPYDVLEDDLKKLFATCGRVHNVTMEFDASGRSLGRATVLMDSAKTAKSALESYDGCTIDGRTLKLTLASDLPVTKEKKNVRKGLFGTALQATRDSDAKPRQRRGRQPRGAASSGMDLEEP